MTKINNNNNFEKAFNAFKEKHGYEFNYQFIQYFDLKIPFGFGKLRAIKKKLFFLEQTVTIKKIKESICEDFNIIKENKYNPKNLIIRNSVDNLPDNKKIDLKNIALKRFLVFWKH